MDGGQTAQRTTGRQDRLDFIRFLLMLLILFGHSMELFGGETRYLIYRWVYLFHIPAFLFLTGYFARFNGRKILRKFFFPYLLAQGAYLLFMNHVVGGDPLNMQFSSPYWILWYLLVITVYYLLLPLLDAFHGADCFLVLGGTVLLALLAGYESEIGYYLALSRVLVFLPFFAAGHYLARGELPACPRLHTAGGKLFLSAVAAVGMGLSLWWVWRFEVSHLVLYGACGYEQSGSGLLWRLLALGAAACWTLGLFLWVPNVPARLLRLLGRNTYLVFLTHGFLLRLEGMAGVFHFSEGGNILLALVNAALLYLVLGGFSALWYGLWRRKYTGKRIAEE